MSIVWESGLVSPLPSGSDSTYVVFETVNDVAAATPTAVPFPAMLLVNVLSAMETPWAASILMPPPTPYGTVKSVWLQNVSPDLQ
jgi:hypothetical protein